LRHGEARLLNVGKDVVTHVSEYGINTFYRGKTKEGSVVDYSGSGGWRMSKLYVGLVGLTSLGVILAGCVGYDSTVVKAIATETKPALRAPMPTNTARIPGVQQPTQLPTLEEVIATIQATTTMTEARETATLVKATETPTAIATLTAEGKIITEIKLPEVVTGSIAEIENLMFNMEFKEPAETYKLFWEAFIKNPENKTYFADLKIQNYKQLIKFAQGNTGGPESKNYWLPLKSPGGNELHFLRAKKNFSPIGKMSPVSGIDGIYIDGMYAMVFISTDLKDLDKKEFID
jgi:hypothetical protein